MRLQREEDSKPRETPGISNFRIDSRRAETLDNHFEGA